jgi:hypothetical protein
MSGRCRNVRQSRALLRGYAVLRSTPQVSVLRSADLLRCGDAAEGGTSVCGSEQRPILGATAPWWLRLIVQLLIVGAMVVAIRSRRRGDAERTQI